MRKEVILETMQLWAGYGGKPVLQGVDLSVREGEIVAVIGRNGVGKSTLIKSLIGLLPPQQGAILYKGAEVNGLAAHRRARLGVGYVPQGRDVFPRMSVYENLLVGQSIDGSGKAGARERIDRIYGYFPILKERRDQRAGTLSGGQQQQLAIGRVLMGDPAMILLDEPSEGIQPNIVQDIARIMVELNRDTGITVVFVEQNLDMIRQMAERCYVMDKGTVTAEIGKDALEDRDTVRRYLAV